MTHLPSAPNRVEEFDHLPPLSGIEPGEGFVQGDHQGVVDDGLGQLDPLAHPLGVGGKPPNVVGVELHRLDSPTGGLGRVADPVQVGGQFHELPTVQVIEQRLLLGGHADSAQHGDVGAGVSAQHSD